MMVCISYKNIRFVKIQENKVMIITDFAPKYAKDFKTLNLAWLEKYFWVEPHDEEVLSNPQSYIIDRGGFIFYVLDKKT